MIDGPVVLLDFDGPVTLFLPPPAGAAAADTARHALHKAGVVPGPAIASTEDHLAVLRWVNAHAAYALPVVERACDEAEARAAVDCLPTPGAHEFLASTDKNVVIVSNNTESAIRTYLERWNINQLVFGVVGRPPHHPELMKPATHTVEQALALVGAQPRDAVLVGDSVSDIEVALATGVRPIGYAKTPRRGSELHAAGADTLITSMLDLIEQ
jgi:phosphoglycolate phosphatase